MQSIKKKQSVGKKIATTSMAAAMAATSLSSMAIQAMAAENTQTTNVVNPQTAEDTNLIFQNLLKDAEANMPIGQKKVSLVQNYQSNQPQEFTYYLGGGSAEVNNGLRFTSQGQTVAAFKDGPFLSSGIATFKYRTTNAKDTGFAIKTSNGSTGLSIRHESGGNWVIQDPETKGKWLTTGANPLTEIKSDEEATVQIGFFENRFVFAVNGTVAYDSDVAGTENIFDGYPGLAQSLGQVGIYSRHGGETTSISNLTIQGVGTQTTPTIGYQQDYEDASIQQRWSNNANVEVKDDGTGNKVLEVSRKGGSERVVDLNSPEITNGTLSLNYKVINFQSGLAFGFRYNDNGSRFNELGVDGANQWIPESSTGWGSDLGLPEPNPGIWNNLMINFLGKDIRVFLNKELVVETTFDKYEEVAGKLGFRLRGSTKIQIDNLTYTSEILAPEEVNVYENDFEDSITGTWSNATTAIVREGQNRLLHLVHTDAKTLSELAESDKGISEGTMKVRVKSADANVGLKVGDAQIIRKNGTWVATHQGEEIAFTGDAATEALKERVWNDIAVQFSGKKLVLSIHGKLAEATLNNTLSSGAFGLISAQDLYVDDVTYSEKMLDIDTSETSDKVYYEEYYETVPSITYNNLTNPQVNNGRLTGNIAPYTSAINTEITELSHGVYQFKASSSNGTLGLQAGSVKVYSMGDGKWYAKNGETEAKLIGEGQPFSAGEDVILRTSIVEGTIQLSVNQSVIGSLTLDNITGGEFGIYNPSEATMNVSIDAIGAEELRVYTPAYPTAKHWSVSNGNATSDGANKQIDVKLDGVSYAKDLASPSMSDQHVDFDFKTNVDASASGGRYGITLRTIDEKDYVGVEHDINGTWRVAYKGNEYNFQAGKLALEKDKEYHFHVDFVGTTISLQITDNETKETTDLGSINIADLPKTSGQFGVRGWYSGKTVTLKNLKVVEEASLPIINKNVSTGTLTKDGLSIQLDRSFPRILSYDVNGKTMEGQADPLTTVNINGMAYTPDVTSEKVADNKQDYVMDFKEIGVKLHASIEAQENFVVSFQITNIEETGDFKVRSISMSDNRFANVNSAMEQASYAYSSSSGAWHGVTEELQDDLSQMDKGGVVGTTMSMISGNGLAASIENNVMDGGNKVVLSKEKKSLVNKAAISNGTWTYRHAQSDATEELPWAKIVLTEDVNNDQKADWQDGAVAYRRYIFQKPFGAEDMANNMMYIAFNFASQANDPFLNTLETGKVLYNYTDGFGQMILHKGYQGEGHDDDIPSYSNIGIRQGGVKDFNYLINEGAKYHLNIGVHINATEYHLDANELKYDNLSGAASGKLLQGWDWIDTAYYVDQTKDVLSGELQKRFASLQNLTKDQESVDDPTLDFYYIDVYTGNGYNGYKLMEYANDLGLKIGTEFSGPMEPGADFVHWGPDLGYPNKGNKSVLSRMVKNELDIFVGNALFKGQKIPGVTTWGDSKPDMQQGVTVFNNEVLPTKYMQHHGVLKVEEDQVQFEGDVTSTRNKETQMIELRKEGKLLSSWADTGTTTAETERHAGEATSLIPWVWDVKTNEVLTPETGAKLYHWNPQGGTTTWELTSEFANVSEFTLYELTQQGKVEKTKVPVVDGKVSIDAEKNTPYVLYETGVATLAAAGNWGEGSAVSDFAFNAETLNQETGWQAEGTVDIEVVPGKREYTIDKEMNEALWNRYANITGEGSLSQSLNFDELETGQDYTVSVWTQVNNGTSTLSLTIGDQTYENSVTGKDGVHLSSFKYVGTTWQRVSVEFHLPKGVTNGSIQLTHSGEGNACFDDVKVWKHTSVESDVRNVDYAVKEDFENVSEGWGPFEYGGGSRQISITNDQSNELDNNPVVDKVSGEVGPVMTWALSGSSSLKINETDLGRSIKTNESSLKLAPNTKYTLSFDYTSEEHSQYNVTVVSRTNPTDVVFTKDLDNFVNNGKANKDAGTDYAQVSEEFTTNGADDYQVIFTQIRADRKENNGAYSTYAYAFILDNFAVQEVASKDDLQSLYDRYLKVAKDHYTTSSWNAFQTALQDAKTLLEKEAPTSKELTKMCNTLNASYRGLAEVVGRKELKATIAEAKGFVEGTYSKASWDKLQKALTEGECVINDLVEDMEEISKANNEIKKSMEELVNITELKEAVTTAEAVTNENFTKSSWHNFTIALQNAKAQLNVAVTMNTVATAIQQLQSTQGALIKIGDFTNLQTLVDQAKLKVESDYSSASWEIFAQELKAAEEFLAYHDSSQAEINDVESKLAAAMAALVERIQKQKDSTTGIEVEYVTGTLPVDAILRTSVFGEKTTQFEQVSQWLNNVSEKFTLYDARFFQKSLYRSMLIPAQVDLSQVYGEEVAIQGTVKLRLPIPDGYNVAFLSVYLMRDDGTWKEIPMSVEHQSVVFTTDQMGTFVLADTSKQAVDEDPNKDPDANQNQDSNQQQDVTLADTASKAMVPTSILAILGASILAFFQIKKRKKQ